jgi:hypothetical protein
LLVSFIPALLMLATFGLDRLEAGLTEDAVSPADVTAALDKAKADCARRALPRYRDADDAADDDDFDPWVDRGDLVFSEPSPRLPARIYVHHRSNPEFLPTRQADRV